MATHHFTVTAPGTASDVLGYMARFSNASEWDPGVVSGRELVAGPPAIGSRYELVVRLGRRQLPLVYEIKELVPGQRVVLEAENALVRSRDVIEVSDVGTGAAFECRLGYGARLSGRGAGVLLEPLLSIGLRRLGRRAEAGLRERLGA